MTPEFWQLYCTCLSFLGGACVGSFLNVCIHRIPREESIVAPRSRCPGCKRPIKWHENIPLLSWVLLGGKCRGCKTRISIRYPLVELLTALLFWGLWTTFGASPLTGVYMLAISGLILGTFVDFDIMELPNRVTIGGMIAGPILSTIFPIMHQAADPLNGLIQSLLGLIVGAGILQTVRLTGSFLMKQEAMGFGDVKLIGAIGAFFGWQGTLFSIMAGSLLGALIGVFFIAIGKKNWGARIPFGPFLALASVIWIFQGNVWWNAYISWITGG